MDSSAQREEEEEAMVALPDTRAHPRAVMVVHLDTRAAVAAME